LENSPLEIKTDSELGSDDRIVVRFYQRLKGDFIGGVGLYFFNTPKYWINRCSTSDTNFETKWPSVKEKVWRIHLISGIRIVVDCNEVEVLNILLSSSTCSESSWNSSWIKNVKYLHFNPFNDSASDYYRPQPGN